MHAFGKSLYLDIQVSLITSNELPSELQYSRAIIL